MRSRLRRLPGYSFFLAAALFFDATGPAPTRADVPPPRGYVESCTIKRMQKKYEFCTPCKAWHEDPHICERSFLNDQVQAVVAWEPRCRGYGASVWTEIYCIPWFSKKPPTIPRRIPKSEAKPGEDFSL